MNIVTYNILPTAMTSGLIEIVPDSETLYTIKEKHKCSVQNYILGHNSNLSVDEVRGRFIRSTAAYCVMTYLLGIGDRHLDNIMVTRDGYLFHIDYSFVLGLDPKPLAPKMRITSEMIDALGGVNSVYYKQFEEYCSQCYNILRKHANLFSNMLFLLTKIRIGKTRFTPEQLEVEICKRFLPGEYRSQAKIQLIKTINNSQAASTFVDFLHYHYKENISKNYELYNKAVSYVGYYNPFSNNQSQQLTPTTTPPKQTEPIQTIRATKTVRSPVALPILAQPAPKIVIIEELPKLKTSSSLIESSQIFFKKKFSGLNNFYKN
jgi:hypothetical protein